MTAPVEERGAQPWPIRWASEAFLYLTTVQRQRRQPRAVGSAVFARSDRVPGCRQLTQTLRTNFSQVRPWGVEPQRRGCRARYRSHSRSDSFRPALVKHTRYSPPRPCS
jgi:hypothetical protein